MSGAMLMRTNVSERARWLSVRVTTSPILHDQIYFRKFDLKIGWQQKPQEIDLYIYIYYWFMVGSTTTR